jgi:hypothetical protein
VVAARVRAAVLAGAALIVWAVAHVAPAAAQRAADEAEREYRLGYEALEAGDCSTALVHYRRSLELKPRPRTLFNIAACEEELGLEADAWRSYHAFLDLAEARDSKIVVKAKARIAALRAILRGKLTVETSPAGASVLVDDERRSRGVTPLTLSLEPGVHTIRVTMQDATPAERVVTIVPDEVASLSVALELPSTITVITEPDDATIEPAGGGAAATGRYEAAVAPGRHVLTVRRDGYLPEQLEIDAVAGRSHVERVRLRPLPSLATNVVAGEIVVTGAGRTAWRDQLRLSPGDVVTVELDAARSSPRRRALAWGLGGLGVASIAGGSVVGALALRDVTSPVPEEHDRGKRRALLADGLIVVGAVAVIAAWRWLRRDTRSVAITRTSEGER